MNRLVCGDVLEVLPTLGRFKCLIADPPDNIGLGYDEYDDNLKPLEYIGLFHQWLQEFVDHADIAWVSFNAKWIVDVCTLLGVHHGYGCDARLLVQTYTFGQNRDSDCGNGYRPLLRLKHKDAVLYPDAIKVPSARQTKYKDKRAKAGGRVPLDVWDFPRVCGTFKQRRSWHKTQLHEGLIERIIKFSTVPGDAICDAFSGTGTVLRVAKDRPVTSIELSVGYCARIAAEHGLTIELPGMTGAA